MFFDHFQFTAHPFAENPPVEWILRDPRMNEALARLRFFQEQGSMALIIGATGVGKSSLLRLFIHELPPNRYLPLYLHLTPINATAFLRLIVTHLGEAPRIGKDRLFLQIIDRIRQHDKSTLLMIDEAHMLDPRALTDLRLLISSMAEKLPLTIILCGQESLRQTLRRASHADLVHRIPVRFFLKPLTKDQTAAYIDNRLTLAGGSPTVFDPETKGMIHDYTGGVPRQINNVATACLINGAAQNLKKITEPLVNQTMAELHLP
jgi:general secretion pathway protein A